MSHIPVEIKKLEQSQVEIAGEIPSADFESERAAVLKKFGEKADIPGFRKGHVPDTVLLKHFGEEAILYEMAEQALKKAYPAILEAEKIDAIGEPRISLTKLAAGNPLGFKITTSVMPDITLPDYAKLAASVPALTKEETTDKEVQNVIDEIRKARGKPATDSKILTPDGKPQKKEPELPELTDEFAKSLGDFKDVADLKAKIKENIAKEKEFRARDKRRVEIIEKILKETSFAVPEPFIQSEMAKILGRLKDDISRAGLEWDMYLKQAGKTEVDIAKEMRPEAEKRAKIQLIVHEIAHKENITPEKDIVEHEIKHIMEIHQDADKIAVQAYVESVLLNEAIFKWLEKRT